MYRICRATNYYYYVQSIRNGGWSRCSPFFRFKSSARSWVLTQRKEAPCVVEYL